MAEFVGSLVELAFLEQSSGQVKACLTEIRLQFERFAELLDGRIPFLLPGKVSAGSVRRARLVAIDLLPVKLLHAKGLRLRSLCVTLMLQKSCKGEVCLLVGWVQSDRLTQFGPGA